MIQQRKRTVVTNSTANTSAPYRFQHPASTGAASKAPFGTYADVSPSVIEGVKLVHIDDLKPHEEVLKAPKNIKQEQPNKTII